MLKEAQKPREDEEMPGIIKRLLSVPETAKYLNISERTIYNGTGKNAKKPFPVRPKRIGGSIRFDRYELDRWLEGLGK